MRNRLILISTIVRSSLVPFMLPCIIMYVLLPLLCLSMSNIEDEEYMMQRVFYAAQILIPVSGMLWPMVYLQIRIDSDGQEAIRSCQYCSNTCIWDLVLLEAILLLLLAPAIILFSYVYGFRLGEFFRLFTQITFTYGLLYLLSALLQNVSMSGMVVISYMFFSAIFSDNRAIASMCVIQNTLTTVDNIVLFYVPILVLSVLSYYFAHIVEKKYTPK